MTDHILLVDDEPALVAVLDPVLRASGYQVTVAGTASGALRMVDDVQPDLVLLDLGLPDGDGKAVVRDIRTKHDTPIIIVSARHREGEKITALDDGADDYVDKPFEIGELMARVRAALRRRRGGERATGYRSGELAINYRTRRVSLGEELVQLSPKEYDLLLALARSAGQVVTRKRLLAAGWGAGETNAQFLRVYISLLRQKIERDPGDPQLLLTEPGVGYRLVASEL